MYIDTRELQALIKKLDRRNFKRLESNYINEILFGLRKYAATSSDGIQKEFVIRNKGLARAMLRITKCRPSLLLGYFGSTHKSRFTGWAEQWKGTRPKRKRIAVSRIRGPGLRRKIPRRYRVDNSSVRRSSNVSIGNSKRQSIAAFIASNRRQKYSGPLIINDSVSGLPPAGLYQLYRSGKLKSVQLFKQMETEPKPWAKNIIIRYLARVRVDYILARELHNLLRRL